MARPSRASLDGTDARAPVRAFVPGAVLVVLTPSLWRIAFRQLVATSPSGWWRRAPFMPRPDRGYVRFRIETAYGPGARPGRDDLAAYLRWCKESAT